MAEQTKTAEQRAEDAMNVLYRAMRDRGVLTTMMFDFGIPAVAAAIRAAEREALERAAGVADGLFWWAPTTAQENDGRHWEYEANVGTAIRSLIPADPPALAQTQPQDAAPRGEDK